VNYDQELPRFPAPGTARALIAGCTCPLFANGYGRGFDIPSGEEGDILVVFAEDCPVHADVDCILEPN
jgi:hypothetical protein